MKPRSFRSSSKVAGLLALGIIPIALGNEACTGAGKDPSASTSSSSTASGGPIHVMRKASPSSASSFQAAASAHLTYFGGRVISNVQVVEVLWGGTQSEYLSQVWSTASPSIATFYQGVTNSPYWTWLTEYDTNITASGGTAGTNQTIGAGSFKSQVHITPSTTATTVDDSVIQSELTAQIAAGHLPAPTHDAAGNNNTYYAVFFPHGTTITQGGSSSCVAGGFCAYHGTVAAAGSTPEFYYGVHPDMQAGSGCDTGCGTAAQPFGNYTSVASHELTEATTDAEVGLATTNGPPLAWYDNTNGEIGDICNANQGSVVGSDGVTYVVQKEWSNSQGACIDHGTSTTTNDFSLAASPSSLTVKDGSSASDSVTTAITSGSAESISLAASGLPAGVTVSFSPVSVSSGASSTATVNATSSAAPGTYSITITGTAPSGSHSATVSLTVQPTTTPTNDFSIALSPTSLGVTDGSSATDTVDTAITSGSAESISLAASGAPAGVTVSFSPTSVSSGGTSSITVNASATAAAGTYPITVTGTAASGAHSATLTLTVSTASTGGAIANGGFETGTLAGWTGKGAAESVTSSDPHSGTYAAMLGKTTPTNGTSEIVQTFTAPAGKTKLSVWYANFCPDTVTYDWATAVLKDNTTGKSHTFLAKTCAASSAWTNVTTAVTAGHSYTLTLESHDDNYPGDPTYTLYDDVTLQ